MFVAGYDTDVIKRWGRWKSASFTTYLWIDDMVVAGVGRGMMFATGLLPQLKRQSGDDRNRKVQSNDDRAGGKGGRGRTTERMVRISKKLSHLCRHDLRIYRQKDGFVSMEEVTNCREMRELGASTEEIHRIVGGDGGNFKKRFELGHMMNGKPAVRTSQGHSAHAGVTSDYLEDIGGPGRIVHGTSIESAEIICSRGLGRMDRLHIHFGKMIRSRKGEKPAGIRGNAEAGIVFDGAECIQRGVRFHRSANDVILTEGLDGRLPPDLVVKVFTVHDGRVVYTRENGWVSQHEGSSSDLREREPEERQRWLTHPSQNQPGEERQAWLTHPSQNQPSEESEGKRRMRERRFGSVEKGRGSTHRTLTPRLTPRGGCRSR